MNPIFMSTPSMTQIHSSSAEQIKVAIKRESFLRGTHAGFGKFEDYGKNPTTTFLGRSGCSREVVGLSFTQTVVKVCDWCIGQGALD
jgi:hypothetical protein